MTWTTTRLKYVARVGYGLGQPPTLSETGIPILRATNITRGKFTADGLIFAAKQDLPLDRAPLMREGEILVVRSGAYTGDSAIVTSAWVGSAPGYDLRVTPMDADPRYLAYCLLSTVALDQVDLAKSRAAQPHLNAEDLGDITLRVPSLDEQRRIADFLDVETAWIDCLDELAAHTASLLAERRNVLIERVIVEANAPTRKLFHCLRLLRDGTHQPPPRTATGIPLLTARNVSSGTLQLTEQDTFVSPDDAEVLEASLKPACRDVLLSVKGTVGASAIIPPEFPRAVLDRNLALLRPQPNLLNEWLVLVLRTRNLQDQIRLSVAAAAQPGLPLGAIRELRIPDVGIETQKEQVHQIEMLEEQIGGLESKISSQRNLLTERRQTLITAAVTGQIDVAAAGGVAV
jgi:type I restriction enzyme S subunit